MNAGLYLCFQMDCLIDTVVEFMVGKTDGMNFTSLKVHNEDGSIFGRKAIAPRLLSGMLWDRGSI